MDPEVLRLDYEFILEHRLHLANLVHDRSHVGDRLRDVSGARLALRPYHRGSLADTPQRLSQITCSAYEGDLELPLVDMIGDISGGQYFAFINEVDAHILQYPCFGDVSDSYLGHDRNRDSVHDLLDKPWVSRSCDAAFPANIGRNPFECNQ